MAIQAGRVGVDPRDVTLSGRIKGGGDIPPNVLTKEEAARIYQTILGMANYLTKVEASQLYQTISDMVNYQAKLVSGTNIKRINGEDLLGSGNISVLTNEIASGIYQTIQGMSSYALKSEIPDTSDMLTKTEAPGYDDILTQTQADDLLDEKMDLVANPVDNNILLTDSTGQAKTGNKKLSDLQELLTAGTGIDITSNTISNQFASLANPDLDTIKYNYQGYVYGATNIPTGANNNGLLCSIFRKTTTDRGLQIYVPYNSDEMYFRRCSASAFNSWVKLQNFLNLTGRYNSPDLNTLKNTFIGYVTQCTNGPPASSYGYLYVNKSNDTYVQQLYCPANTHMVFERQLYNGTWTSWEKITTKYYPNDTFSISREASEYNIITGQVLSASLLAFSIPVPGPIVATGVSITAMTGCLRQASTGTTTINFVTDTSYTLESFVSENGINFTITKSGHGLTLNSPVMLDLRSATFKFS